MLVEAEARQLLSQWARCFGAGLNERGRRVELFWDKIRSIRKKERIGWPAK